MIDSHCHLEFRDFDKDRNEVIAEAKKNLVAVVDSCAKIDDFEKVLNLHRSNPNFIFPSFGIHPTGASTVTEEKLNIYKSAIRENSSDIVAIGEVGLDNYHIKKLEKWKKCKRIFADFVDFSDSLDFPVVIHSRDSMKEVMEVLKRKEGDVIIHCFSGELDDLQEALDRGYYISLGGMIFRRKKKYREIIDNLPLDNLLLETDSPFLAKEKSDRSEPWLIEEVAGRIAEVKEIDKEKVWFSAGRNAKSVYELPVTI